MRPCKCGQEVRLGAMKIRLNGKHGICHYITHQRGNGKPIGDFMMSMMKPYPKDPKERTSYLLIQAWDAAAKPARPWECPHGYPQTVRCSRCGE